MRTNIRTILAWFLLFIVFKGNAQSKFDVVVYGATPSGIAAAINAAKEGMQVGLIEPSDHFGGIVTAGMSNTDFKSFESLGGTYLDFMLRIENYYRIKYGEKSQQFYDCYHGAWYEPHVARNVLLQMFQQSGNSTLFLSHPLREVVIQENNANKKLTGATFQSGARTINVQAKVFIDATYEGDLLAMAGAEFRVGRESRSEYGELFAGVKYYDQGKLLIGSTGEGDNKIQCYNFRICVTKDSNNSITIQKPKDYNPQDYQILLDEIKAGKITAFADQIVKVREIPNDKADINDLLYSPISLRLPGENYGWPNGTEAERKEIFERHKSYSLGLLYFLQNHPEIPESIKNEVKQWGLPKDEFQQYGNFPPALYIREGRRLKGDFVLTESDTQPMVGNIRSAIQNDAIAICDYSLDSHGNGKPGNLHPDITEGVFNRYVQPYQISYRVTLPAKIDGLLVSCAVSASHVAFSSLRMEPTWTAIGQATGIAAAISVKSNVEVRYTDVSVLQQKLHKAGAKTIYLSDIAGNSPHFELLQHFGTKGYFHFLPEYENQAYTGRGGNEGMRGQHIQAYPYHKANVEKLMDRDLAQKWLEKAGLKMDAIAWKGKTRLEFLEEINSY